MLKLIGLCIVCLVCSPCCWAGEIEDGVYVSKVEGEGLRIKRNDGAEVVLGKRLGHKFGTATIRSIANDNSKFVLDLKNAGPLADGAERHHLALVIDGIYMGVWSHSDRHPDGTMDLSCSVHGDEAAQKVAAHLKAELQRRKHPGHRLEVRWSPEKTSYEVGEPVTLKMEIRNAGSVPVLFYVGGQQRGPRDNQFRFLAYPSRADGKAVPDTGDPKNFGGKASFRRLKPGESFVKSISLDKWFTFTEPDGYRITGLYELQLLEESGQAFPVRVWDELVAGDCVVRIVAKGK